MYGCIWGFGGAWWGVWMVGCSYKCGEDANGVLILLGVSIRLGVGLDESMRGGSLYIVGTVTMAFTPSGLLSTALLHARYVFPKTRIRGQNYLLRKPAPAAQDQTSASPRPERASTVPPHVFMYVREFS